MTTFTRLMFASLAMLGTRVANAQPPDDDSASKTTLERFGLAVTGGGGVEGFTGDTMRNTTTVGGSWFVRAAIGTKSIAGFEASYLGSAQAIDALGLDTSAVLVGNGVQGALRVNAPVARGIQSFAYGGLAWRRYDLTNASVNTSDVSDKDNVLEVPLGIGVGYAYRGFLLDARGEFRVAASNDLVPAGDGGEASMHRWGVNANLGYQF